MNRIILASQSPRRKELLTKMGLEFDVVPSEFEEKLDDSRSPDEVAAELALGKALDIAKRFPDSIVIGSDTIVAIDGKQLEKPHTTAEAEEMLKFIAGRPNFVITGTAIVCLEKGIQLVSTDSTWVFFKTYDQAAADAYVATGDPMDKAGGYGIQSGAAGLISYVVGHFDTVVGLPTHTLSEMLRQVGVTARPVKLDLPIRQVLKTA